MTDETGQVSSALRRPAPQRPRDGAPPECGTSIPNRRP